MNASLARRVRNAELYTLAGFRSTGAIRWAKRLINGPVHPIREPEDTGTRQSTGLSARDDKAAAVYKR